MTQYNTLNIKLSNVLKISSNVVGDSNDENNFCISCCQLIYKFQSFVKLLQMIPQLI